MLGATIYLLTELETYLQIYFNMKYGINITISLCAFVGETLALYSIFNKISHE